ncbi:MAG: hypothetical protein HY700_10705 [Gemmatimonadetes bacterium]|nr:hypothetical protein [Gemmatimonadota bacterium]
MNRPLAFKAEVVLAFQLILRHRAPRLALLLAGSLMLIAFAGDPASRDSGVRERTMALVAGVLAAVAASRLLAAGAPLWSVRRTASPWLLAPAGRLAAAVLFAAVPVVIATLVIRSADWFLGGALVTAAKLTVYAAAVAACTMALTPLIGASAAATMGLLGASLGAIPPSAIAVTLEHRPFARGAAVLVWNSLPLGWRAVRWAIKGGPSDGGVLTCWILLGIGAAVLVVARHAPSGGADSP